jgi:hypothetical protein
MHADWPQAATAGRGSYRKLSLAALPQHPRSIRVHLRHLLLIRHYVANATWLACIANHTVIPAKAGTYAAWVPAFAGMTMLCGVCYIMPC